MEEIPAADVTIAQGVASDFRGKPGRRQVTVMTRECWEAACRELGKQAIPWTVRRANLIVEGVELAGMVGFDLCVGDAVLTITGETTPCYRMDEQVPGLFAALKPHWRGGVICRVTRPGRIAVGSEVVLTSNAARRLLWAGNYSARETIKTGLRVAACTTRALLRKEA